MWPIVAITFLEGIRSRVLYGIFIFSMCMMFLSVAFSNLFMREIGKVAVDFNLSAISFAGLLICFSLSTELINKDLERKTIYFVLSKPISRCRYIFGKFFGIMALCFFAYLILFVFSAFTLVYLKAGNGQYFESFSWLAYIQALYFDLLKLCLLNAVIFIFSVLSSSSFISMLFSISAYIVGQTIATIVDFINLNKFGSDISSSISSIIGVAKYVFPNFSAFDFKVISAHGMIVSGQDFAIFTLYAVVYVAVLLCATVAIFNRKEFL